MKDLLHRLLFYQKIKQYLDVYLIVIAFLGLIIYSNTFHAPFEFDDMITITQSKYLKMSSVFTKFNMPRYIAMVTFALNYKISKLDPCGYHVINLIIHIINGLLVYALSKNIFLLGQLGNNKKECFLAAIIAAIFISHPIQTSAVTYISQRFTSLATLFTLCSVILYIRFKKFAYSNYWLYAASLLSAILAYKTKENTATLFLTIIIIEFIFLESTNISIQKRLAYSIPYILLVSIILISFMNMQDSGQILEKAIEKSKETIIITRSEYLLTELRVINTYMRLLVLHKIIRLDPHV